MEFKDAYNIMDIEINCVHRNITHTCDRKCENCDLVQKDTDLIEAYTMAKFALKQLCKSEWNNYAITMNEIFDENGNYIYPTDVVLDEPNTVIGYISTSDKDDETITQ